MNLTFDRTSICANNVQFIGTKNEKGYVLTFSIHLARRVSPRPLSSSGRHIIRTHPRFLRTHVARACSRHGLYLMPRRNILDSFLRCIRTVISERSAARFTLNVYLRTIRRRITSFPFKQEPLRRSNARYQARHKRTISRCVFRLSEIGFVFRERSCAVGAGVGVRFIELVPSLSYRNRLVPAESRFPNNSILTELRCARVQTRE